MKLTIRTYCINRKIHSHTKYTQSSIKSININSLLYQKFEGYHFMLVSELGFVNSDLVT